MAATRQQQRDLEFLEARVPGSGRVSPGLQRLVLREDENGEVYVARDYDHIDAREPKIGSIVRHVAGLVLREAPEFDALD